MSKNADRKYDPVIVRAKLIFDASGKTLDELGMAMGATKKDVARKSAWQFFNGKADPRLGTLRKFAAAMGISVLDLFADEKAPAE